MTGKTCTMKRVFLDGQILASMDGGLQTGDYVAVKMHGASATALLATPRHLTTTRDFVALYGSTVPTLRPGQNTGWRQQQQQQQQQDEAAVMHG